MSQDYAPCGKCGQPMKNYSHMVYQVTWMGRPVCSECVKQLQKGDQPGHQGWQNR